MQSQLRYSAPFLEPWLGGLQVPLFWIGDLHTPAAQPEESADSVDVAKEKPKEEVKEESPNVHAARLGMYGVMTREMCTWQPARLLCERFAVTDAVLEVLVDTSGLSAQTARPEFTGTALADEFAGASARATQVESGVPEVASATLRISAWGEMMGGGMMCSRMSVLGWIFLKQFLPVMMRRATRRTIIWTMSMRWTSPLLSKRGPDVKALPANVVVEDVDLATFKPTFILRGSKPKDAEKKEKKTRNRRILRVARLFPLM
ncbi:hypothetical protein F4604DRAFT_473060 [Suillus subluteus]|nr:hypothetical protein F4604DRAFT_473060 [Suillus subluteus]